MIEAGGVMLSHVKSFCVNLKKDVCIYTRYQSVSTVLQNSEKDSTTADSY